ncbi:MAG: 2-oxoacid:acceptor oxidoreductase family protein [Synergistaceae bacterium]|jgi:indolepyruvate ferredoxin oxidoreductase beta subunit|nr:2-oxoacid:acceptor oxidoreductase family protein [Synergistaceae bacterium]
MKYVIVGIGGQGILFTSKVLGKIAIEKGLPVIGNEVHGMAQRGGSVISHFKVGDYRGPLVTEGRADVLMAFDQSEGIRNLGFLREGGTFLVNVGDPCALENARLKKFLTSGKIRACPFLGYEILDRHMGGNYLFLNVLILGTASGMKVEGFEKERVVAAIKELAPPKHLEANLKVFELGMKVTNP